MSGLGCEGGGADAGEDGHEQAPGDAGQTGAQYQEAEPELQVEGEDDEEKVGDDGAECMSVRAVAGLIKFFSAVSRPALSTCPGRDLPGQPDGLLRTSLPGKTVTGQDPACLDRLDLFQ